MIQESNSLVVTWLAGPKDSDSRDQKNPKWEDIERAIRRLDGDSHTMVILGIGDPTPHMGIAGGGNGKYIVYITPDNLTFFNLLNLSAEVGTVWLKAGGQFADYELKLCVALSDAIRAARVYAETGNVDPELSWEKQP